ncbi:MAG: DUF2849 domain-containing protein [Paracoccaceae bacterium]
MAKPFSPQVVTANDLLDGDAVWLTAAGTWALNASAALVLDTAQDAARALAAATAQQGKVVGPYLADVSLDAGRPVATHTREALRMRGPSNYFHGKQESAENV